MLVLLSKCKNPRMQQWWDQMSLVSSKPFTVFRLLNFPLSCIDSSSLWIFKHVTHVFFLSSSSIAAETCRLQQIVASGSTSIFTRVFFFLSFFFKQFLLKLADILADCNIWIFKFVLWIGLLIQKKTLVMKQDYWASIGCAVMQSSNTEVTTTTPATEDCSLFCAQITPWVTLHSLPIHINSVLPTFSHPRSMGLHDEEQWWWWQGLEFMLGKLCVYAGSVAKSVLGVCWWQLACVGWGRDDESSYFFTGPWSRALECCVRACLKLKAKPENPPALQKVHP